MKRLTRPSVPTRWARLASLLPTRQTRLALLLVGISLGACVLAGELVARALGLRPWSVRAPDTRIEPGGRLFEPDPVVGFRHLPGRFTIDLPTGASFVVTHGPDTLRITGPPQREGAPAPRGEVWIFGCSFTHGWTLDDDETYPWLLQERLPEWQIVNFGVGGYGTVNSLLQFERALETRPPPAVAVVAYASFHDERNTLLRQEAKNVVAFSRAFGERWRPRARLARDGSLDISLSEIEYRELPLMRHLALVHWFERLYDRVEDGLQRSDDVSLALLERFRDVARQHAVALVIAGIDPRSGRMLTRLAQRGFAVGDISVDPDAPEYAERRDGVHPNPAANRAFAEGLEQLLRPVLQASPNARSSP